MLFYNLVTQITNYNSDSQLCSKTSSFSFSEANFINNCALEEESTKIDPLSEDDLFDRLSYGKILKNLLANIKKEEGCEDIIKEA